MVVPSQVELEISIKMAIFLFKGFTGFSESLLRNLFVAVLEYFVPSMSRCSEQVSSRLRLARLERRFEVHYSPDPVDS